GMVGGGRGGMGWPFKNRSFCARLRLPQDTRRTDPMAAVRTATVTWQGPLDSGEGTVTAGSSGMFTHLPTSGGSRTEQPEGRTSPEELLAAAHSACFAMAFSADLGRAGYTP